MNTQTPKENLSGNIERITYHNKDNGFCVLRIKVKGHKDLVTVTGSSPTLSVGEYIKCSGIWHNDSNYGKQFKADFLKALILIFLSGCGLTLDLYVSEAFRTGCIIKQVYKLYIHA